MLSPPLRTGTALFSPVHSSSQSPLPSPFPSPSPSPSLLLFASPTPNPPPTSSDSSTGSGSTHPCLTTDVSVLISSFAFSPSLIATCTHFASVAHRWAVLCTIMTMDNDNDHDGAVMISGAQEENSTMEITPQNASTLVTTMERMLTFYHACRDGSVSRIHQIITTNTLPTAMLLDIITRSLSSHHHPPLTTAAIHGHIDVVSYLIHQHHTLHRHVIYHALSLPNIQQGWMLPEVAMLMPNSSSFVYEPIDHVLCVACQHGHVNLVRWCLDKNASLLINRGHPIKLALISGSRDLILFLLTSYGIPPNAFALPILIQWNHVVAMNMLLSHGATTRGYPSLLFDAVCLENVDMVELLLSHGCTPFDIQEPHRPTTSSRLNMDDIDAVSSKWPHLTNSIVSSQSTASLSTSQRLNSARTASCSLHAAIWLGNDQPVMILLQSMYTVLQQRHGRLIPTSSLSWCHHAPSSSTLLSFSSPVIVPVSGIESRIFTTAIALAHQLHDDIISQRLHTFIITHMTLEE